MDCNVHSQRLTYHAAGRMLSERGGMPLAEVLSCCADGDPSAVLLSDQCRMSIGLQARGDEPVQWRGCILSQFADAMEAIDAVNPQVVLRWRSEFTYTFPRAAVQEALANAIIHCDASAGSRIEVVIGGESMVIRSPGRSNFRPGGGMVPRNAALAAAMVSMGWATLKTKGLMAILDAYRRTWSIPRAEDCGDGFQVTLPALSPASKDMAAVMDRVFDILRGRPGLTAEAISRELLISPPTVRAALCSMEAKGRIFSMGQSDRPRYYPVRGLVPGPDIQLYIH